MSALRVSSHTPPFGVCWKQKPTVRTWPMRYARIEGKSLNVYADERDTKKRGSSITDVTGCQIEKGMESWMLSDDKPKLVLKRADLQGGGVSSFAFDSVELRDMFFEAVSNIAEGRDWDVTTASVIIRNSYSANTLIEWMYGDAGTDMTRGLARKNPLRWTSGTVASVADTMRGEVGKKQRPIDVRVKGRAELRAFTSQAEAVSWLEQVQRPPEAASSSVSEPEPEPEPELELERSDGSVAPPLQKSDRYDSVTGTTGGAPPTPPRIHGHPAPPDVSPAKEVLSLIRSASDPEMDEILSALRAEDLLPDEQPAQGGKTPGGRIADNPIVSPDDLDVTDEDRRHGFVDWRDCAVNGAHLESAAGKGKGFTAQGAKGFVHRAVWKRCLPVAIKKATDQTTWSGDLTTDGLTDEMRLFLDLTHPHIVACYGILQEAIAGGTEGSTGLTENSIVTERCQTSLQEFLSAGSKWVDLSPAQIDLQKYTILTHVSLGLQKLHDMGVLHRDIKCNNVLLDGEHSGRACDKCKSTGRWKICDFGEAVVLKSKDTGETDPSATIERTETDNSVTAANASPEMLDGTGIGLPTDMFGFGVLMWEVFTRQEAWHWVTGKDKINNITYQVLMKNSRPKIPHGLAQSCAKQIRLCVAKEPQLRPTAKAMSEWLENCRRNKLMALKLGNNPVRERHMLQQSNEIGVSIVDVDSCAVCAKGVCQHWSKGGRYSIHPTWLAKGCYPVDSGELVQQMAFNLKLVAESGGESWTEPDRTGSYDSSDEEDAEPEPESGPAPEPEDGTPFVEPEPAPAHVLQDAGKPSPLGIVFKGKNEDGKMEDQWPKVKRIRPDQVAAQFEDYIQAGCRLLAINDQIVDDKTMKFKDAVPLIQNRPLTLCFSSPDKWTDVRTKGGGSQLSYVAAAAVQAGLACVGVIRQHEAADPTLSPVSTVEGTNLRLTTLPRHSLSGDAAQSAEDTASPMMQAELQRLQDENASLTEQLAAQGAKLAEAERGAAGLAKAVELVKQSRAEAQALEKAKDAEIAVLQAQLQKFEGVPPRSTS
jgi:serine/threonine protein kinase